MPMYEYECTACGSQFDLLRRMDQADSDLVCQNCASKQIKRRFSLFASLGKAETSKNAPEHDSGNCGGGGTCTSCTCQH